MTEYEPVIGLEVHCQLNTKTKIFCSCPTAFGAQPNTQVCPICLGLPGVLPVLNQEALKSIIKAGLIFGSQIASYSKFDRKNYFYPDLPKAYQISQYDLPICLGGTVSIEMDGQARSIRLHRIHLEEDAGKLLHQDYSGHGSAVDYNRTGTPLIEIVSEPDLRSPKEAFEYLTSLKRNLKYLNISDCNMEEGSLRCDANVSVRPKGREKFGTRAEVKNMNSFHNVEKAIQFEIERQIESLERGERVVQETRLWDPVKMETRTMRSKEEAHDYRYFPDPDLTPLKISKDFIEELKKELPEAPHLRKDRFKVQYSINDYDAGVLTSEKDIADFYEKACKGGGNAKSICNWISTELLGSLKDSKTSIYSTKVKPLHISQLVQLIEQGKITGKTGKSIFQEMLSTGNDPEKIVESQGLTQIQDTSEIEKIIEQVIQANPKPVEDFKAGKKNAVGFLVGQAMRLSKGKANPEIVQSILVKKLS